MTRVRVTLLCVLALVVCSVSHAATKPQTLTLHGAGVPVVETFLGKTWLCLTWPFDPQLTKIAQICEVLPGSAPPKKAPAKKGGLSA